VDANSTIARRAHQTGAIQPKSAPTRPPQLSIQGQNLESSASHKRCR